MKARQKHLFNISGSATKILQWLALPPFTDALTAGIPPQSIQIMGENLDASGNVYVALQDGDEVDVTPYVKGEDYYAFNVNKAEGCAPMELNFSDMPYAHTNNFSTGGYTGNFTLQAVCRWGWGTNDWYPLATFTWGYDVDANGQQHPHQYTTNSGCNAIIVDSFTNYFNDTEYTNIDMHGPGVHLTAHYIGCCDNGELNWVQTYVDVINGVQLPPQNDWGDTNKTCIYYWTPSEVENVTNLSDYTDYEDWINGTCP